MSSLTRISSPFNWVVDKPGRIKILAQPQRNEHARGIAAKRAGKGAGSRPYACAQRRLGGSGTLVSGGVKTFREGGGLGGRPGSRTGGGGGGDSGGAGRGVSPGVVRQNWGGRPRRVGQESGCRGRGGRGADLLGVVGASASGKSILPSWRETAARTSLACCLGLDGLPDSLDCFYCSELLPGLCPVLRYPAPVCLATKELFLQSY